MLIRPLVPYAFSPPHSKGQLLTAILRPRQAVFPSSAFAFVFDRPLDDFTCSLSMGVTTSAVSLIGATCASVGVPSVPVGLGSPKSWMTTIGKSLKSSLLRSRAKGITARSSLLRALHGTITKGHLTIVDGDGSYTFGNYTKGCNVVEFRVVNADFWTRVFM